MQLKLSEHDKNVHTDATVAGAAASAAAPGFTTGFMVGSQDVVAEAAIPAASASLRFSFSSRFNFLSVWFYGR